jgi:precorrin-2 dehydrogenase/sirohydrochlorin ferrochelatase
VASRGDLTVAVSTGGGSPALARRVREDIDDVLGPEYERALDLLTRLRRHLRGQALSSAERRRIFTGLVSSDLLERLRDGDEAGIDRLLAEHAGGTVSLESLGMQLQFRCGTATANRRWR